MIESDEAYKDIFISIDTLECAENRCIPCFYKLFPSGVAPKEFWKKKDIKKGLKLRPNVRPEMCPRFKLGSYSGLYSGTLRILTVGDGDLSFSLSIANYFFETQGHAHHITATTHETYESVVKTYTDGEKNVRLLKKLGVSVFHGIDATNLSSYEAFQNEKYDVVIWNFPCIRISKGADGQVSELDANIALIRNFFHNVGSYLTNRGEVHVAHKTIEPFSWWNIKGLAEESNFSCKFSIIFDRCNYPGYVNRKVLDKKSFPCNDAQIFVFALCMNEQEQVGDEIESYKSNLLRITGTKTKKRLKKLIHQLAVQSTPSLEASQHNLSSASTSSNIDSERVHKKQKIR